MKSVLFFLLIVALSLSVIADPSLSAKEQNERELSASKSLKDCSSSTRLKIDSHVFAIPTRKLQSIEYNGKWISLKEVTCRQPTEPPGEVSYIYFQPTLPDGYLKEGFQQGQGFAVFLGLSIPPKPYKAQDTYERVVEDGRLSTDLNISTLPIKDGFYVLKYKPQDYLFIPADKKFITPSGNPVVFLCSPYAGREGAPLYCDTHVAWRNNISIAITNISETWIPKTELQGFYHLIMSHIESLEEKPETHSPIQANGGQP